MATEFSVQLTDVQKRLVRDKTTPWRPVPLTVEYLPTLETRVRQLAQVLAATGMTTTDANYVSTSEVAKLIDPQATPDDLRNALLKNSRVTKGFSLPVSISNISHVKAHPAPATGTFTVVDIELPKTPEKTFEVVTIALPGEVRDAVEIEKMRAAVRHLKPGNHVAMEVIDPAHTKMLRHAMRATAGRAKWCKNKSQVICDTFSQNGKTYVYLQRLS